MNKMSDKTYKILVNVFKALIVLIIIASAAIFAVDRRIEKLKEQQANASLPAINNRINNMIKANDGIYGIKTHFEYNELNYISVYVTDVWFYAPTIQQKRFAANIRDNVKAILYEEGFIEADDRVGIYVYTTDGIPLAEDNMFGEIKLID